MYLGLRSSSRLADSCRRAALPLASLLALLLPLLSSSPPARAAVLTEVRVTPVGVTMEPNEVRQFFATAIFSDGSSQDITAVAEWTTGDSSTAKVSQEHGSAGVVTARAPGSVEIRAALEFGTSKTKGNTILVVDGGPILAITTRPSSKNLDVGFPVQFKARAEYTRPPGYNADVTDEVTWATSDPSKASVSPTGLVTPHAPTPDEAPVVITATHTPSGLSNSADDGATKVKAAITHIDFDDALLDEGTGMLRIVLGVGMVDGVDVYAHRVDGSRSRITRDVTFSIAPGPGVVEVLADGDDPDRDDEAGEIHALKNGIVAIRAGDPERGFITERLLIVEVAGTLDALEFSSDPFTATVGDEKTVKVNGRLSGGLYTQDLRKRLQWETAHPAIATVGQDSENIGKVTGQSVGTTTLTATEPNTGVQASVTVRVRGAFVDVAVDPEEIVLGVGMILPLRANGIRSDGSRSTVTTQVGWELSPPGIAQIDPEGFEIDGSVVRGVLETLAAGNGTLRAVLNPGTEDEIRSAPVPVSIAGTLVSVSVRPDSFKVVRDQRRKATLEGTLSTGEKTNNLALAATWNILDTEIALVGDGDDVPDADDPLDRGEVLGLATGVTTLVGTEIISGLSSTEENNLRVQGDVVSVKVDPAGGGVVRFGAPGEYKARATFSDGSTSVISDRCEWSSDDEAVATVNNTDDKGIVTGLRIGDRTIIRIDCEGLTALGPVEVAGAILGLEISPESFTGKAFRTRQFRAAANYEGGIRGEFTDLGTWRSDNPTVATVDDDEDKGQVSFHGDGSAFIVVTSALSGHVAIASVVVEGGITRVRIAPNEKTVRGSTGRKLKVVADLSDGDKSTATKTASWDSSNENIAYMSEREGEEGIVIGGTTPGTATITATLPGGESGTATITVESILTGIEMRPDQRTVQMGKHRRVTARGLFSDENKKPITRFVEFRSDDPNVAIVQSFGSKPGRVIPVATGTTRIRAIDPTTGIESANSTLIEVVEP